MRSLPCFLLFAIAFGFVENAHAQKLKWSGASEKSPVIDAEFVRIEDGNVVLKKDGKEIPVPLSKLSLESHLQALKLAHPEAYAKPVPKAPVGLELTDESKKLLEYPFPEDPSVEQFLDKMIEELDSGNSMVLWHALTPEMQADVEDIVLGTMDSGGKELLVQIKALTRNLATLVRDKKTFILANPMVGRNPQVARGLELAWPHLVSLTETLADKPNWDIANFRSGNFAPWLAALFEKLKKVNAGAAAMAKLAPAGVPTTKESLSYKVVSQKGEKASVQTTNPQLIALFAKPKAASNQQAANPSMGGMGSMMPNQRPRQPAPNAPTKPEKIELVKVSGRWLPKVMVDKWKDGVADAKKDADIGIAGMSAGLALITPIVSTLAKTSNQQEFNAVVDRLAPMFGQRSGGGPGMMGMSPGGPDMTAP